VHLKGQGRLVLEIRLDFIGGVIPRRAAARETLAGVTGSSWICAGT
jgi:hypothetical protein